MHLFFIVWFTLGSSSSFPIKKCIYKPTSHPVSPLPQTPVSPLPQTPVSPLPQTPVSPLPQTPVSPLPTLDSLKRAEIISKCVDTGNFALTLDDGPSKNVPEILEKLKELNVPVTFFVNAKNYADLENNVQDKENLAAIFNAGHQIGTHSYKHADMATLSYLEIYQDMNKNDAAIKAIIGKRPRHFRPPFLSVNVKVQDAMGTLGYKIVSTNLDTKDYENNGDPNEVLENMNAVSRIMDGVDSNSISFISLEHDFTSKIVETIEELVIKAKAMGFRMVTVGECIGDVEGMYRE
jgi:peptidoglycan/xylan/chitin deacetylase (PgdA/CDA1 family)